MEQKNEKELIEEINLLKKRIAELEMLSSNSNKQQQQQQQDIRRLAMVVRDSNDAVTLQDFEGNITAWNRGAELMYGYNEKEAIGINIERLIPPGKIAEQNEFTNSLIKGEEIASFETQRLTKDGRVLEVWLTVTKVLNNAGEPVGIASTARDITVCKKTQEKIKVFSNAVASAFDSFLLTSTKGDITYVNESACTAFGYTPEEFLKLNIVELEADPEVAKKVTRDILTKGKWSGEVTNIRKNGEKFVSFLSAFIIKDEKGDVIGTMGILRDITEQKKINNELEWKTELLEAQIEASLDGLLVVDENGQKILINNRMLELWQVPRNIVEDKDDATLPQYVVGRAKNPQQFLDKVKYLYAHKNETSKDEIELKDGMVFERYSSPVMGKNGKYYGRIWTFRDITERKNAEEKLKQALKDEIKSREVITGMMENNNRIKEKLERNLEKLRETQAQLIQSEKMEAIGRMASGIAHEVKNPLGVILQGINYLEDNVSFKGSGNEKLLQLMKSSVKRADNIVHALLDFSRAEELKIEDQDINTIIKNSLDLVQHELRINFIECISELEKGLPKVLADSGKMEQVFVNLFNNALDASPKGGKLYVRTYLLGLKAPATKIGNRRDDIFKEKEKAVIVEIEDTGAGIDEDIIDKVFDPFFTTKNRAEGTGLGLSIVKSIMEMHKGFIKVESKKGKGTKFTIFFKIPMGP